MACGAVLRPCTAGDRGAALLVAMMATVLLAGLGAGLSMLVMTEARIAANFSSGVATFYAAEAAATGVLADLLAAPHWNEVLAGTAMSRFVDGAAPGPRALPDGTALDLAAATSLEQCGRAVACGPGDVAATSEERPYGANNPVWRLYAHGPIDDLVPGGAVRSRIYAVVWIGDDPLEEDGDPLADAPPGSPGHGRLAVRARAYGPYGARRGLEIIVAREGTALRVVSWREL